MTDTPWLGDACSLVDAFRAGDRSPSEELEAVIAAIEASALNAFSHLDLDAARELAATADPSLPFGGLPFGIKELEQVAGWPYTEASLVFADRVGTHDTTHVSRMRAAGVVPVGATTASEFGGLNVSVTRINGITGNAWDRTRSAEMCIRDRIIAGVDPADAVLVQVAVMYLVLGSVATTSSVMALGLTRRLFTKDHRLAVSPP